MRPGSVIVDMAADAGGNVEGTVGGENVEKHGVTIIGASNLARSLAADASALFARNLYNFLAAFWDKEQGRPVLPDDDEIVKGDPPDARRQGRARAADRRLTRVATAPTSWSSAAGSPACRRRPRCPAHARVTVLEAEEQIGFHSSGRSATMLHYALGDRLVRALTLASRPFFDDPPDEFSDVPLGHRMPVLIHAREDERAALDALEADIAPFAKLERLDASGVHELCPLLQATTRATASPTATASGSIRTPCCRAICGSCRAQRRRAAHRPRGSRRSSARDGAWRSPARAATASPRRSWSMPRAPGPTQVAALAGVRPLGLQPKRRTIITFDAPPGTDLDGLPFAKTVGDELYFAPESGRLFASPMDEVPSDPCDAQPDEYEVALAAYRMEERTTSRSSGSTAAGRAFAPSRPTATRPSASRRMRRASSGWPGRAGSAFRPRRRWRRSRVADRRRRGRSPTSARSD